MECFLNETKTGFDQRIKQKMNIIKTMVDTGGRGVYFLQLKITSAK